MAHSSLIQKLHAFIHTHQMISAGAPVVIAVSGGPDSLCLLHALAALRAELGITLHVAHLDHMIRGAESAAEAAFVADLARQWLLPATVEAVDVPALARQRRANLHAAARAARYAFLARVAQATSAQAVAVAHHAGDQAETVLLHLLRGAGPEGLSGMRPVVGWEEWRFGDELQFATPNPHPLLIRPLLATGRDEIERYCAEHGLQPRYDPSNFDLGATRNRIRHDLLPRLIEYNPHVIAAFGRTAAVCAEEHAFVRAALEAAWPHLAHERAGAIDFDGPAWRALHPALQREAIRRAHAQLARHAESRAGGATLELEHVERTRALIERGTGRRIDLPGSVTLVVGYGGAFTIGAEAKPSGPQLPQDELALPAHGQVALGDGWQIVVVPAAAPAPRPTDAWEVYLDLVALAGPLQARRRRPGDRLRTAAGSQRLQDLFVDAKVPRALRDAWPVIASPTDVVWVPGLRAAREFVATEASEQVMCIRIERTNSNH